MKNGRIAIDIILANSIRANWVPEVCSLSPTSKQRSTYGLTQNQAPGGSLYHHVLGITLPALGTADMRVRRPVRLPVVLPRRRSGPEPENAQDGCRYQAYQAVGQDCARQQGQWSTDRTALTVYPELLRQT